MSILIHYLGKRLVEWGSEPERHNFLWLHLKGWEKDQQVHFYLILFGRDFFQITCHWIIFIKLNGLRVFINFIYGQTQDFKSICQQVEAFVISCYCSWRWAASATENKKESRIFLIFLCYSKLNFSESFELELYHRTRREQCQGKKQIWHSVISNIREFSRNQRLKLWIRILKRLCVFLCSVR